MQTKLTLLLVSVTLFLHVVGDREADAFCKGNVGKGSWCKCESGTCKGDSKVKCSCKNETKAARGGGSLKRADRDLYANHLVHDAICTQVDAGSWCVMETMTCHDLPGVSCALPRRAASADRPVPRNAELDHDKCRRINAGSWCEEGFCWDISPRVPCRGTAPVAPVALDHDKCRRIDSGSWCEEGFCWKIHPKVPCGGAPVSRAVLDHDKCRRINSGSWCEEGFCWDITPRVPCTTSAAALEEAPRSKEAHHLPKALHWENRGQHHHRHGRTLNPSSQVLWTEMPSVEHGGMPDYFTKMANLLNGHSCSKLKFHRVIVRVPNPTFKANQGPLWEATLASSFYRFLLTRLTNPDMEVYIYPYLLERDSVDKWMNSVGGVSTPLEAVYKYVQGWNELLDAHADSLANPRLRITGIAVDYEEGKNFKADVHSHLQEYKARYPLPDGRQVKFGIAIGFEGTGAIKGYPESVDEYYLEMYDWYVHGSPKGSVERIEAHNHGSMDNPERFMHRLEHEQRLVNQIHKYEKHSNIIFSWSVQNRDHNPNCLYPLPDGRCGLRNDFGAWRDPSHYKEFLNVLSNKFPIFSNREHALYQFSFLPRTWYDQC